MIGRRTKSGLQVALVGALCLFAWAARAEDDRVASTEKLFREGVDLYMQGKYSDAQQKLKQCLALEPRKELAHRLVEEAGPKIMTRMMSDVRMGNEAAYIWNLYRQYQVQKFADKERMTKLAARLVDAATTEDERAQIYREFGELGHHAVPFLAGFLKNATHEDHRTVARIAIARMGTRAVLPVLALLPHSDVLMRQNAILVLSDIQPADPRIIPALRARMEDPNEQPAVKNVAARVLQRVTGLDAGGLKPAAVYYHDLANRYYLDRPGVAEEAMEVEGGIWHLNAEGELVVVKYPLWAWNEQYAEQLVLDGMAVSPDHAPFYPLWASILAAQATEARDLLAIVNDQGVQHNFSAEEKADLEAWNKKLVDARRLIAASGKENVNAALNKVHADILRYKGHARLPEIGAMLADELAMLDPRGELLNAPAPPVPAPGAPPIPGNPTTPAAPGTAEVQSGIPTTAADPVPAVANPSAPSAPTVPPPPAPSAADPAAPSASSAAPAPAAATSALVAGLDSPDEIVQYHCALALAAINRQPEAWAGSDKVGSILGRGVSENKPLQILLVEEEHNSSNELRDKLVGLGYGVTQAISGRDALYKGRSFPPKDIALIAENVRRDMNAGQLIEELHSDARTRYLPVGILHPRTDRTLIQSRYGTDVPLVERESAGEDLRTAVKAIEAKRATESVPKKRAHDIAVACAEALAKVDPRSTQIKLDDAVKNAFEALENRPVDVRIPAAVFLGRIEGGSSKAPAADALKRVVKDTQGASVELRRAALRSLGRVQPEGLEELYLAQQADPDQEIKDIAAQAMGQKSRSNKAIQDFIRSQRIDKEKKEK